MHVEGEMSRNHSIHHMHHSYFNATNCGANCLGASYLWDKSSLLFAQLPLLKIFWTGLQSPFSAKVRFLVRTYIYLSYHIIFGVNLHILIPSY